METKWKDYLIIILAIMLLLICGVIVYKIEGYKTIGRFVGQTIIIFFIIPIVIGIIIGIPSFVYNFIKEHWTDSVRVKDMVKFLFYAIVYIASGFILNNMMDTNRTDYDSIIEDLPMILFLPAIPTFLGVMLVFPMLKQCFEKIYMFLKEFVQSNNKTNMIFKVVCNSITAIFYLIIILIFGFLLEFGIALFGGFRNI